MRYLLVLSLLFLAGCGGGSAPSSGPPIFNLPVFNTSRVGTWNGNMHGPLAITILADRRITGMWQQDSGPSWIVTGQTSDTSIGDYGIELRYTAQGMAPLSSVGPLVVKKPDHLIGTMSFAGSSFHPTYDVDLTRQ